MTDATIILLNLAEEIEKIIVSFGIDEKDAAERLKSLDEELLKKRAVEKERQELFDACLYNARATINTAPLKTKRNDQLLMALADAKEEIREIIQYIESL